MQESSSKVQSMRPEGPKCEVESRVEGLGSVVSWPSGVPEGALIVNASWIIQALIEDSPDTLAKDLKGSTLLTTLQQQLPGQLPSRQPKDTKRCILTYKNNRKFNKWTNFPLNLHTSPSNGYFENITSSLGGVTCFSVPRLGMLKADNLLYWY